MIKVNRNTEVEVGKFYLVKCAVYYPYNSTYGKFTDEPLRSVPIIGDLHKDTQFGLPNKHYHIDGRFVSHSVMNKYQMDFIDGFTNHIIVEESLHSVIYKKMKCKRINTGLNVLQRSSTARVKYPLLDESSDFQKWYKEQVGKSCKGKRCPHLGYTMKQKGNKLFCPLHNLVGCAKTEKVVEFNIENYK